MGQKAKVDIFIVRFIEYKSLATIKIELETDYLSHRGLS